MQTKIVINPTSVFLFYEGGVISALLELNEMLVCSNITSIGLQAIKII